MRVTEHRDAIRTEFDAFGAPDLALQLQFSGGSESMGHHHSGFDDWWSVGRRCATLWASLLRQTKQRIRPLFTRSGSRSRRGSFLNGLLGNERIPPAHGQESMPVHVHSQFDEEVVNGEP